MTATPVERQIDCAMCSGATLDELVVRTHCTPGGITVRLCRAHDAEMKTTLENNPLRQILRDAADALDRAHAKAPG